MKILLAEDEQSNRDLVSSLLRNMGHHVTAVADGRKAVDAYRMGEYDLILMDIQMPEMGGFDATSAIREIESASLAQSIPIFAMTAYSLENEDKIIVKTGMNGFLAKPIVKAELKAILDNVAPSQLSN